MKKKIKFFLLLIVIAATFAIFQNKVEAKSYSVENMDIQATVNLDGSVSIKQEMTFKFNGAYNGIYINVPYNLEDIEYDEVVKNKKINDNLYNGTSVTVQKVSLINNGTEKQYQLGNSYSTRNGAEGLYTEESSNRTTPNKSVFTI